MSELSITDHIEFEEDQIIGLKLVEADEYEVEVYFEASEYIPAHTTGLPEDCYPAEGGFENLTAVMLKVGDQEFCIMDRLEESDLEALEDKATEYQPEPDYDY